MITEEMGMNQCCVDALKSEYMMQEERMEAAIACAERMFGVKLQRRPFLERRVGDTQIPLTVLEAGRLYCVGHSVFVPVPHVFPVPCPHHPLAASGCYGLIPPSPDDIAEAQWQLEAAYGLHKPTGDAAINIPKPTRYEAPK